VGPEAPRLIAGFDAGQTHTSCRLALLAADGSLTTLAEGEGPGVSHLAAPEGEQRFCEGLERSYASSRAAVRNATHGGLDGEASGSLVLSAAAIGASGIETGTAVQERGHALAAAALALPTERVLVIGDERTALLGACGSGAGILVISGTGSIAVGQDGQGRNHRCGGWGWLLDGAGSAMDLGRDGLALSLRMADGRCPETPLRQRLWWALAEAEGESPDALTGQWIKARVVDPHFGAAGFARLAPAMNDLAAGDDPEAIQIVERSAAALAELVAGVARQLELNAPEVFSSGGALSHLDQLAGRFERCLGRLLPAARLRTANGDARAGALQLAAGLLSPDSG
jgi:glucosamine kinase